MKRIALFDARAVSAPALKGNYGYNWTGESRSNVEENGEWPKHARAKVVKFLLKNTPTLCKVAEMQERCLTATHRGSFGSNWHCIMKVLGWRKALEMQKRLKIL